MLTLSILIPVWNEIAATPAQLAALALSPHQRIWADGGSTDGTREFLEARGECVVSAPRGRGNQLAAATNAATGEILVFLHVDTRLPPNWERDVVTALERGAVGGAFHLSYGGGGALAAVATFANWRTRWLGLPFGDQAIFCRAAELREIGGVAPLPIMEDVDLVQRLKRKGRLAIVPSVVVSSPRRFRRQGVARTVARDWCCQLAWTLGVSADRIARWYGASGEAKVIDSESPRGL